MMKIYIPEGEDVGMFINDNIVDIEGIERSLTTLTFKTFQALSALNRTDFGSSNPESSKLFRRIQMAKLLEAAGHAAFFF